MSVWALSAASDRLVRRYRTRLAGVRPGLEARLQRASGRPDERDFAAEEFGKRMVRAAEGRAHARR